MKILDRYLAGSVASAFLSGVAMFMVLLCAMSLIKDLIEYIAKEGFPVSLALTIFAYKVPGMLVYAFPMAMLLGILLTFGRMSAESEMVAIRAGGISFLRMVIPTLYIAVIVTGLTFVISNYYAPYAAKKSNELYSQALNRATSLELPVIEIKDKDGKLRFTIQAQELDIKAKTMKNATIVYYDKGVPSQFLYARSARWYSEQGRWQFHEVYPSSVGPNGKNGFLAFPDKYDSLMEAHLPKLALSPDELANENKNPEDLTSDEMKQQIAQLKHDKGEPYMVNKLATRYAQRFSTPFTCIIFALIGAPLGLRHHRSSSAVGLGVSLLVIFVFYFVAVYLSTFGDNGRISPEVAAWSPIALGTILGIILIWRANR